MLDILSLFHVVIAVLLVIFVLLQDSKGGAMGVFGGGGSQSMFGSSGGANFLVKVTQAVAVVFGLTCLALTYTTNKSSTSKTDMYVAPVDASNPNPSSLEKGPKEEANKETSKDK